MRSPDLTNKAVQKWFGKAVRRYPARSAALVLISVLTSLSDGLSISLLIPFLSTLFAGASVRPPMPGPLGDFLSWIAAWTGQRGGLLTLSLLIVLLVAVGAALRYAEGRISNWISGQISFDLRSRIHRNLLGTDFEFICVNDNGRLLNTLDSETWVATESITTYFHLIASICMIAALSAVLLLISWQLTILVAVLIAVVSLVTLPFNRRARLLGNQTVVASEDLTARAVELFDAMRMIRAFGRESSAQRRYDEASRRAFDLSIRSEREGSAAGALQEVLYAAMFVCVVFAGLSIGVTGAVLVAFLALLHRLQPHVRAVDGARIRLASMAGSSAAVARLEALPIANGESAEVVLPELNDAIRFRNVTFAYAGKDQERRNALEAIDLEFAFGKVTAVVGWSGAGKSTLTNLLFRFYDPSSGTITVDGVPLTDLDLGWWRSRLAIAGQDADLIDGTIAENIAYGKDGATFEDVVEAARRASVDDFIQTLPRRYETQVGGRGVLLSGGQRQRIGLARAFIREDALLVLDEATNSLDSMTEDQILRALEALRGKRTVIVIAHRLSTTRMADQVVVLAGGKVAESGTPHALMGRNGLYARMVQLQELTRQEAR